MLRVPRSVSGRVPAAVALALVAPAVAAVAAPVEPPPVGCRDSLVRFHGDPFDPVAAAQEEQEQVEELAVGAEVVAVDTLHVQLAGGAPAAVRDDSDSGENAAVAAVAGGDAESQHSSKAVAVAVVAVDGTTEVAPSSCFGCSAAAVRDRDDDLDVAAVAAAADEPSFLRIGYVAVGPVGPAVAAESVLGQSLANGRFALPVVVPCFAVAVDGGVADIVAAAAADDDCHHPSGSRCCLP